MGISTDDIERIRATVKLSDVVSPHSALRRVGTRWVGRCPFHAEKTGSFNVNDELGFYKCFGCGVSGDVISFVREVDHLDFVGAVESLAAKAGISVTYTTSTESRDRQRAKQLKAAMGSAVEFYHQRLLTSPDAGPARAYLRDRGIDGATARTFSIGWAPEGWDELARALTLTDDVLRDTGLGFVNRTGRQTDALRGRIVFPIFDERGDPVALGGRVMPGGEGPKYKNSPETRIYSKSRTLYGLNWAKDDAVHVDEIVVCEGYTDVIGFHAAGIRRAVATCGTALTEDHVRLLRKFSARIVLAFDADTAGQSAADRFYAWEKAYAVSVAVAAFPPGVDPAELARRDPEALRSAVASAKPYLGFRVDRILSSMPLRTPEDKARAAEVALELVSEHPNVIVRRQYAGEIAVRCGLPSGDLVGLAERAVKHPSIRVATARPPASDGLEWTVLRLLVHRWDDTAAMVVPAMFADADLRRAVETLAGSGGDVHAALEAADPTVAEILVRVAVEEPANEPASEAARLLATSVERALMQLRSTSGAETFLAESARVRSLLHAVDGSAVNDALGELLGWLDRWEREL
jgi:DNA primase